MTVVGAVTRPLEPGSAFDRFELARSADVVFASQDLTLVGFGIAMRLTLPGGLAEASGRLALQRRLASVVCDDVLRRPGTGVVAHGALPFDANAACTLVVPSLTYGASADGAEWVTVVAEDPKLPDVVSRERLVTRLRRSPSRPSGPQRPPGTPSSGEELVATPRLTGEAYAAAVREAITAMASGPLQKVVLASRVDLWFPRPADPLGVLARLADDGRSGTMFVHPTDDGWFIGISPELLVSRRHAAIESHPLAGTARLRGGSGPERLAATQLLGSAKDRLEHELVVRAIVEVLTPLCEHLEVPPGPFFEMESSAIAHLGTRIRATLRQPEVGQSGVLELLAALHPTPAVGGLPRPAALETIARLEPFSRGPWAGPVGWIDRDGNGDWVIGIRSAIVGPRRATIYAGSGIVASSDPEAERAETAFKLGLVLDAFAPGAARQLASSRAGRAG